MKTNYLSRIREVNEGVVSARSETLLAVQKEAVHGFTGGKEGA